MSKSVSVDRLTYNPVNAEKDKEEYDKAKSFRSQSPINEFTEGEHGLVAAFPHVFMLGKAYKKNVSNLTTKDCTHLLMQVSAVPASCQMLIFYLFDIKRRHDNICGMSTVAKMIQMYSTSYQKNLPQPISR